jgi:hypothetical protein
LVKFEVVAVPLVVVEEMECECECNAEAEGVDGTAVGEDSGAEEDGFVGAEDDDEDVVDMTFGWNKCMLVTEME